MTATFFCSCKPFFTDVILGPIEGYSLATISRFANIWELPLISPGGASEAFTHKKSQVSIQYHENIATHKWKYLNDCKHFMKKNG